MKTEYHCQKLAEYWKLNEQTGIYGMYISNNCETIPEARLIQFCTMLKETTSQLRKLEIELKKEGKL